MRSVIVKSAMTPSFMGRIAVMLPGVRPTISLASLPTASTRSVSLLIATIEGSSTTMPRPLAKTSVLAVPRSIARSLEKLLVRERRKFIFGSSLPQTRINCSRMVAFHRNAAPPPETMRVPKPKKITDRVAKKYIRLLGEVGFC